LKLIIGCHLTEFLQKFETLDLPPVDQKPDVKSGVGGPCVTRGNLGYFVFWREKNKYDRDQMNERRMR